MNLQHLRTRSHRAGTLIQQAAGPRAGRQVRTGHSWHPDAFTAGHEAARAAAGPEARLLLVFANFRYDLPRLLAGVADAAAGVPVVGGSSAAELGAGPSDRVSVVIVGFNGDFTVTTGRAAGLGHAPRQAGRDVASALTPLPDRAHRAAVLLTDALAGDQQEMVRGAYEVLGAGVPMVGGGAGDDMRMVTARQFHGSEVVSQSVVAACIGSDAPFGFAVRHGWRPEGESMMVTASRDNDVHALDDSPALDTYLARHRAPAGIEASPTDFAAFALTRPLTVGRRGDVAVRHVVGADLSARALRCGGSVPRGASVWLARGDRASTLESADLACAEAVAGLGGVPPLALLVFDCVGRRVLLGEQGAVTERDVMRRHAGTAPVAGFFSYGEVGRVRGLGGFHNQTIVTAAIG